MRESNIVAIGMSIFTLLWEVMFVYLCQYCGLFEWEWSVLIGETFWEWVEIIYFVFGPPLYTLVMAWDTPNASPSIMFTAPFLLWFSYFVVWAPIHFFKSLES